MDNQRMAHFRERLQAALHALEAEDAIGHEGQKTVALDQQAVGRLSRSTRFRARRWRGRLRDGATAGRHGSGRR